MQISKTALFGGALMSAGIAHASNTFQFAQSPYEPYANISYAGVQAYGPSGTGSYLDSYSNDITNPEVGIAYEIEGWGANASVTSTQMSASAYSGSAAGNSASASAGAYAYLRFDQDTDILLTWNFADTPTFAQAIQLFEVNEFILDFVYDWQGSGDALAGSREFTFEADITYWLFGFAAVDQPGQVSTFSATVIPAPATTALAGLVGMVTIRRRR